jgi:hypothetical protein
LNEPLDRLAGFQLGRFIVTRPVFLPPGRYTVESVAADQEGERVAVKKSALVVGPPPERGAGLSDITLVRRMDKPADSRDPQDPFQMAAGRIVPTLADTVPGGTGKMLSLYFLVYPDAAATEAPKLVLDLVKDGQVVTRSMPQLPPADSTGAVPYLANLPLDQAKPGQYQFRATLIQGTASAQKSMFVNVE